MESVQAETIAAHGHRAASSDVGVAVALLGAGFRGARLNVEINLDRLHDQAYVEAVKSELERLEKTGAAVRKMEELKMKLSDATNRRGLSNLPSGGKDSGVASTLATTSGPTPAGSPANKAMLGGIATARASCRLAYGVATLSGSSI